MDDLSGLEWTSSTPTSSSQKPPPFGSSYPTLRPTPPVSGRSTPARAQPPSNSNKSLANPASRSHSSTLASDSFANLVSFSAAQPTDNLSLQEQQRRLQAQRGKKVGDQKRPEDTSFGADGHFWDKLGDGKATSNHGISPPSYAATDEYGGHKLSKAINKPFANIDRASPPFKTRTLVNDGDDLLTAFNAATPVDSSSHLPAPYRDTSDDNVLRINKNQAASTALHDLIGINEDQAEQQDTDLFGLGTGNGPSPVEKKKSIAADDDDVLGLLARPVSEFVRKETNPEPSPKIQNPINSRPNDHALAELVDMGFQPDKSKEALGTTESGTDVQAAVGWLLNQAHEESRKKTSTQRKQDDQGQDSRDQQPRKSRRRSGGPSTEAPVPAWMRGQSQSDATQRRQDSRSPVNGDNDPAKIAAELGNNLFKTANSLWKTGTKKLNQAVSDLNSDSDSSQPKWMREASVESTNRKPSGLQQEREVNGQNGTSAKMQQRRKPTTEAPSVTDEALMLELQDARPVPRRSAGRPKQDVPAWSTDSSRDPSPAIGAKPRDQDPPHPRFLQKSRAPDPRSKLTRQAVEEQSSQAYISPARRKKAPPKPPSPERDLLFGASQATSKPAPPNPRPKSTPQNEAQIPSKSTIPTRPPPPRRVIPSVSDSALQSSSTSRRSGTAAFKRGDYADATTHYTSALSPLPQTHPLGIVVLTNRALAHLKTGDPKSCIADATAAVTFIGPSRGISETINLGDEGSKDMNGFWAKAMTRQAEALEQLERWPEAAAVWKTCVEANVGGATSIAGRNRCEKATAGPSKPSSTPRLIAPKKSPLKPVPKPSALDDLSGRPTHKSITDSAEAVTRLRAANAAADRLDDEKFALSDQVSERVARWKGGKEGNLRALLASLELVLWEGAGWKKVGMGELILAGRVKVVYMRGIGRVHPDKVCLFLSFSAWAFFLFVRASMKWKSAD